MRPDIILPIFFFITDVFSVFGCVPFAGGCNGGDDGVVCVCVQRALAQVFGHQNWLVALFFMISVALLLITEF